MSLFSVSWMAVLFTVANLISRGETGQTQTAVNWGYHDTVDEYAPNSWLLAYPACNGSRQSPIEMNSSLVVRDVSLRPLEFVHYDQSPSNNVWSVVDNGHSVIFTGAFGGVTQQPALQGGGLNGTYMLLQFHFHWGSDDSRGSEHVMNGRRLPLELHLVHRKVTDDEATAMTDSSGLAAVGILFDLAPANEPNDEQVELLTQALTQIVNPMVLINVSLNGFNLSKLLPENPEFYRYLGSLTTPPCSEAVVWSVLKQPMKITENQLKRFRLLQAKPNNTVDHVADNFRPTQPYNGRVIRSFQLSAVNRKDRMVAAAATNRVANSWYQGGLITLVSVVFLDAADIW